MFLLFLESLGTTELLVIVLAALVLFGPRRLPQLARSLGKSMGEFRRASDEFKRSWESEVEQEEATRRARLERAMLPEDSSAATPSISSATASATTPSPSYVTAAKDDDSLQVRADSNSIARGSHVNASEHSAQSVAPSNAASSEANTDVGTQALRDEMVEPARKRDWL